MAATGHTEVLPLLGKLLDGQTIPRLLTPELIARKRQNLRPTNLPFGMSQARSERQPAWIYRQIQQEHALRHPFASSRALERLYLQSPIMILIVQLLQPFVVGLCVPRTRMPHL